MHSYAGKNIPMRIRITIVALPNPPTTKTALSNLSAALGKLSSRSGYT